MYEQKESRKALFFDGQIPICRAVALIIVGTPLRGVRRKRVGKRGHPRTGVPTNSIDKNTINRNVGDRFPVPRAAKRRPYEV